MVSGDAMTRSSPSFGSGTNLEPTAGPIQPVKWTCERDNFNPPSWPPGSNGTMAGMKDPQWDEEGVGFPNMYCDRFASPLRADIHFPSCYNPDAGLTNHKENMVYPTHTDNYFKEDCPEGYIHLPHLLLEVYWDTAPFQSRWTEGQGVQPFVLSNGDATGYSSHADFMSGWDEALLQHIIDTCNTGNTGMDTCPDLFYGLNEGDCSIPSAVDEVVDGVLGNLPGNNPITGWQYGSTRAQARALDSEADAELRSAKYSASTVMADDSEHDPNFKIVNTGGSSSKDSSSIGLNHESEATIRSAKFRRHNHPQTHRHGKAL